MLNPYLEQRLKGIQDMLMGAYEAVVNPDNTDSKIPPVIQGDVREFFVDMFLSKVFPPQYRFGTGFITDQNSKKSGQLDIVIEWPFSPSLPIPGYDKQRLYIADGVVAVIEIKSNLKKQWEEVEKTGTQLRECEPKRFTWAHQGYFYSYIRRKIPFFAVGYTGWGNSGDIDSKLNNCSNEVIDGVLIIDKGIFLPHKNFIDATKKELNIQNSYEGPSALWAFISVIHQIINTLVGANVNTFEYFQDRRRKEDNLKTD